MLSTSEVKIGDTYFATAWGFSPEEKLKFSIVAAQWREGCLPHRLGWQ